MWQHCEQATQDAIAILLGKGRRRSNVTELEETAVTATWRVPPRQGEPGRRCLAPPFPPRTAAPVSEGQGTLVLEEVGLLTWGSEQERKEPME